jgi:dihydroflavonol-4-reductase
MKAFVTGSTGLLGSNLVRGLLAEGYAVKALVRSEEKGQRFLGDTAAELVVGDMLEVAPFEPHLAGCDVLFHAAAYFREYYTPGKHNDLLQRINVDATIALLEAAQDQGVINVVYTSSSGVLDGSDPAGFDETSGYDFGTSNQYFQSKIRAEQAIDRFLATNPEMRIVLVQPGGMVGPGDSGPTATGEFLIRLMKGNVPVILPGQMVFADARDVAQGMVRAVSVGKSGERFLLAGHPYKVEALIRLGAEIADQPAPGIKLAPWAALTMATLAEATSRLTGKPPMLMRTTVNTLLNARTNASSAKAERELGVTFRPIADSIWDAIEWFRQYGYP